MPYPVAGFFQSWMRTKFSVLVSDKSVGCFKNQTCEYCYSVDCLSE